MKTYGFSKTEFEGIALKIESMRNTGETVGVLRVGNLDVQIDIVGERYKLTRMCRVLKGHVRMPNGGCQLPMPTDPEALARLTKESEDLARIYGRMCVNGVIDWSKPMTPGEKLLDEMQGAWLPYNPPRHLNHTGECFGSQCTPIAEDGTKLQTQVFVRPPLPEKGKGWWEGPDDLYEPPTPMPEDQFKTKGNANGQ